jgi:hypothetical protein
VAAEVVAVDKPAAYFRSCKRPLSTDEYGRKATRATLAQKA